MGLSSKRSDMMLEVGVEGSGYQWTTMMDLVAVVVVVLTMVVATCEVMSLMMVSWRRV